MLDTESIAVDQVVLAVPPPAAEALLPGGRHARAGRLGRAAGRVPDRQRARPVRPAGAPGTRSSPPSDPRCSGSSTGPSGSGAGTGQYLAVSLSAAGRRDRRAGGRRGRRDRARAGRAAAGGPGRDGARLLRHPGAHRDVPAGAGQRRPAPAGRPGVPGLALAGAWTDTGWPATMESAVRSRSRRRRRAARRGPAVACRAGGDSDRPWPSW